MVSMYSSILLIISSTASAARVRINAPPHAPAVRDSATLETGAPAFTMELSEAAMNMAFNAAWEVHLIEDDGELRQFGLTSTEVVELLLNESESDTAESVREVVNAMAEFWEFECSIGSPQVPRVSISPDSGITVTLTPVLSLNVLLGTQVASDLGFCTEQLNCPLDSRRLHIASLETSVRASAVVGISGSELKFKVKNVVFEGLDIGFATLYISGLSRLPGFGPMFQWFGRQLRVSANVLFRAAVDGFLSDLLAQQAIDLSELLTVQIDSVDTLRFENINIQQLDKLLAVSATVYPAAHVSSISESRPPPDLALRRLSDLSAPAVVVQLSEDACNSMFEAGWAAHLHEKGAHKDFFLTSEEIAEALLDGDDGMFASGFKKALTSVFTFEAGIGVPEAAPSMGIEPWTGLTLNFMIELSLNGILWESVAKTVYALRESASVDARRVPLAKLRAAATVKVEARSDGSELSFHLHHVECHDLVVSMVGVSSGILGKIPGIGRAFSWLGDKLRQSGNVLTNFAVKHLVQGALAAQTVNLAELLLLSVESKDTLQVQDARIIHERHNLILAAEIHRVTDPSLGPEWSLPRWINMPHSVKHCLEVTAYKKTHVGEYDLVCVKGMRQKIVGCFRESILELSRPSDCQDFDSGVGHQVASWAQGRVPGGSCGCQGGRVEVLCSTSEEKQSARLIWESWVARNKVYLSGSRQLVSHLDLVSLAKHSWMQDLQNAFNADAFKVLLQSLFDTALLVGVPKDLEIELSSPSKTVPSQLIVYALFSPEHIFHTVGTRPSHALAVRWKLLKTGCPSIWDHRAYPTTCEDIACIREEAHFSLWQVPSEACSCEAGQVVLPWQGSHSRTVDGLIAANLIRDLRTVGKGKYEHLQGLLEGSVLLELAQNFFSIDGLIQLQYFKYLVLESSVRVIVLFTPDSLANTLGHRPSQSLAVQWDLQSPGESVALHQEGLPWHMIEGSYRSVWTYCESFDCVCDSVDCE